MKALTMRSQLGYTLTAWRWLVALACVALGVTMLRDEGRDLVVPATFLLLGAGLGALEVHLRRSRKTLVLNDNQIHVSRRGSHLGAVSATQVRHRDRASRAKFLIKSLLIGFVCFFVLGAVLFLSGDRPLGSGLILAGMIFTSAAVLDFLVLREVILPQPVSPSVTRDPRMPAPDGTMVGRAASPFQVLVLHKADAARLTAEPATRPASPSHR